MAERRGKDSESTVTGFAVDGAGMSTKFWHRMVVFFVLVMVAGIGYHIYALLTFLVDNLPAVLAS